MTAIEGKLANIKYKSYLKRDNLGYVPESKDSNNLVKG